MIAQAQVMVTLRPWLGAPLMQAVDGVIREIAGRLNGFSIHRDDELARTLDSMLFQAVREATQGKMLIALEDGSFVRVRLEDFSAMADELMLLAFNELPVDSRHLLFLRDYSMRASSLSAIRALYERFREYETADELKALRRVARGSYPEYRWRSWLGYGSGQ